VLATGGVSLAGGMPERLLPQLPDPTQIELVILNLAI
jgi:hypothetical protein